MITDLPLRIERLSSSQIAAAARALIRPDRLVAVVVAPAAEVAPRLRAAGLRFEQVSYLDPIERPRALTHAVTIPADQQARARQLLGQALAAAGGARLREVKEVRVAGRVHIVPQVDFASPPLQGSYRLTLRPPDRLDLTMHLEAKGTALKMSSRQQLAGQGGFIESGGKRRPLSAGRVLRLRQALWRQPILVLRHALAPGVRSRPAPAAAGKLAVELFAPEIPAMTLTLDGASKRLLPRQQGGAARHDPVGPPQGRRRAGANYGDQPARRAGADADAGEGRAGAVASFWRIDRLNRHPIEFGDSRDISPEAHGCLRRYVAPDV